MNSPIFDEIIRSTRSEVDAVLERVPDSLLEARRLITREMQFEPRPEELQAIVKIATFKSPAVECFEIPRQMLALRILTEREIAENLSKRRLCPQKLGRAAALIDALMAAAEQATADLKTQAGSSLTLSDEEREFLRYVEKSMALPQQLLETAAILVPRLEFVVKLVTNGNISETFPGLSDDEIEMFNQAVHLGDEQEGPARVCLDAVALRTIYSEYLDVWERSGYLEDAELIEQLQDSIRGQLRAAETAYRVINERLQVQQDEAMSASLEDFAAEVRGIKSKLFEKYVKTQPLMRKPQAVEFGAKGEARSLEASLAEAEALDKQAVPEKQRSDELYLNALTSLRQDRAAGRDMSMHPLAVARRRYKRKLWLMAATIAVLGVVALGVQLVLPPEVPVPVKVKLKEFQPSLSVIDAKPIGSMLYVRVTDWDNLTVQNMRFRTSEIGEIASQKGLSLAYVVNVEGVGLAEWHKNGGVLVRSQADAGDVISQAEARANAAREEVLTTP